MLKIFQVKLQQFMNCELPDVQAGFRKGRRTRDQIANICWIIETVRVPEKHLLLFYWLGLWLYESQQTWKFLKRGEDQTTLLASGETYMQIKKQQLDPTWNNELVQKLGKEYIKTVYCHPAYLTYMQSTSCEMPCWMKHKLESRFPGEVSITSDMQMTSPSWQKVKRN